jgi:hypothetical protein
MFDYCHKKTNNLKSEKMNQKITKLFMLMCLSFTLNAQDVTVTDNVGSGDIYWTSDITYHLNGGVFVEAGTTLHIEAGTIIKGMPGQGESAAYLCVARDGKIMADGTSTAPIIFTFEADPLDGSTPITTRGQWGGLLVLGNATLNSTPGVSAIEGVPTTEIRGQYGGSNDSDNSGIINYVSIRHGGIEIGAGNEINGLTLAGVGSETNVSYIEVIANTDDGIEFFGGTVSVQHAFVSACGDDSFDYDEGWRGQLNSNWVSVSSSDDGDRGGEHDGGTDPETAQPYATPVIDSAIFIGRGIEAGKRALTFRDNAGGHYSNSIFYNFAKGVDIEDLAGEGADSYTRFLNGDLTFTNNRIDCGTATFVTSTGEDLSEYFTANNNLITSEHSLFWSEDEVYMGGHANWASWTLAMNSGWVKMGSYGLSIIAVENITANVYPNPLTESTVVITFNKQQEGIYTIINTKGQMVRRSSFNGDYIEINNIKDKGLYFINIELNTGEKFSRTIIK